MSREHEHDQLKCSLSLYISREKGHQTRKPRSQSSLLPALPVARLGENPGNEVTKHGTNDLFSHYNLIPRKLKEKMPRKALVNTKRIMCSYPLGIPQYSLNLTKRSTV